MKEFESTGITDLDKLLGGFLIGDNVILEVENGTFPEIFLQSFMKKSLSEGLDVVYIFFNNSPLTITKRFEKLNTENLTLVDCFTEGKGRGSPLLMDFYENELAINTFKVDLPHLPFHFNRYFNEIMLKKGKYTRYIIDGLTGMDELWNNETDVQNFYTHFCPMLFDMETIAYWVLEKRVHSTSFKATLEHVGQVAIELTREGNEMFLQIKGATKRYKNETYEKKRYEIYNSNIKFLDEDVINY